MKYEKINEVATNCHTCVLERLSLRILELDLFADATVFVCVQDCNVFRIVDKSTFLEDSE